MSKLAKALTAAAGNAGESLYVEDVFSTYLYTGTGSTQSIDNGIDLSGEGGAVLLQCRNVNTGTAWNTYDTERGVRKYLRSNNTVGENTAGTGAGLTSFNSNGFTLGTSWNTENFNGYTYASWTFRKAEKFFDVVTYTGNATANRTVSHNLGSVPGCIIVKGISGVYGTSNWSVYHRSLGAGTNGRYNLRLNTTSAQLDDGQFGATATDTEFTLNQYGGTNGANTTYVAYLFASDAGGFGDDGSESIIKCGSYTGTGASMTQVEVDLGFEPQWLLLKSSENADDWFILDNMRPWSVNSSAYAAPLYPNLSDKEYAPGVGGPKITSTGFVTYGGNGWSDNGEMIYIAIRRPMKTPESGTEVFAIDDRAAATPAWVSDFPVDLYWTRAKTAGNFFDYARLRGNNYLQHDGTNAEVTGVAHFDSNIGVGSSGSVSTNHLAWMFKRATGFFDVVAYTGDGVVGSTQAHNLGVAPEMMIVKVRNQQNFWHTYHKDLTSGHTVYLNATYASSSQTNIFNSTDPTDSVFTLGSASASNYSGYTYIAYLFATLAGVSKVGSYIGTGSNVDVDCGFSAGARFVLIKRTDSTGDWYVYDYFRGIVSGNDPYLLLNTGTGEVTNTDYIDPLSSGFTVTSSAPAALNASGGTYIFLAIA